MDNKARTVRSKKMYERFVFTSTIAILVLVTPFSVLGQTPSGQWFCDTHIRLKGAAWTPAIEELLLNSPVKIQSPKNDPNNPLKYDEYSITISKMPPGVTPEQLLERMLVETPNKVANSRDFDSINTFSRTSSSRPSIGEIYDIDFVGPDNGSVMLVERTDSYFVFQTVDTPQTGTHPESGTRQIGFEKNSDGSVTIYTRGVSQANVELLGGDAASVDIFGSRLQDQSWTSFFKGLSDEINRLGGSSDFATFSKFVVSLPYDANPADHGCVCETLIRKNLQNFGMNECKYNNQGPALPPSK